MKICYFFPILKNNDAKRFFEEFSKSDFFAKYKDRQIIFACQKSDTKNLDYLATLKEIATVNVFENNFDYLDAFVSCLPSFDGDILLLGDTSLCDNSLVFEKCLEEYSLGADVVQIRKRYSGVKGFFARIWSKCFNAFSHLVSNKNDSGNVLSLGLYSRDVVEIMQALPDKSCLLKNTTSLLGVKYKTIYIDSSSETYTPSYHTLSPSLKKSIISGIVFLATITLIISLCTALPSYQLPVILIGLFVIIVSTSAGLMMLFKHFFGLRNIAKIFPYSLYFNEEADNKSLSKSIKKVGGKSKNQNKNSNKTAKITNKQTKSTSKTISNSKNQNKNSNKTAKITNKQTKSTSKAISNSKKQNKISEKVVSKDKSQNKATKKMIVKQKKVTNRLKAKQ
ncbi:MAG: hypothetical protein ACI4L7_01825 [Christensenellales bacterium]